MSLDSPGEIIQFTRLLEYRGATPPHRCRDGHRGDARIDGTGRSARRDRKRER